MADPFVIAAAAIAGGTLLSTYAQFKQREAQMEALNEEAELNRLQANELLLRTDINIGNINRLVKQTESEIIASRIKAGGSFDPSASIGLQQLEQINRDASRAIVNKQREADFRAKQLFRAGQMREEEARAIKKTRKLELFGGLLGGAGSILGLKAK